MKLFLDSNVVIDGLVDRSDSHDAARLLIALGQLGVFSLWVSPTQWTDVFYILTEGEKPSPLIEVKAKLEELRKAIRVSTIGEAEIDKALTSAWDDFEDAVVYQAARTTQAAALITSNKDDFAQSDIPIYSPQEFFMWLEKEKNTIYAEVDLTTDD